jgi:hypothetical protein
LARRGDKFFVGVISIFEYQPPLTDLPLLAKERGQILRWSHIHL